jgi:hypothetical protein
LPSDLERADDIVEHLARDPKVQQIVADARMFDELRTHPAWRRLFEIVRIDQEKMYAKISKRVLGPAKNWPTPEEVAYYRGFYQGAIFVLAHPEHAEKNLERAARVAWTMYGGETDDQEV